MVVERWHVRSSARVDFVHGFSFFRPGKPGVSEGLGHVFEATLVGPVMCCIRDGMLIFRRFPPWLSFLIYLRLHPSGSPAPGAANLF
jgi:hypothetical protein